MTTKEKILEAAVILFSTRGYKGTSVRAIGDAVGIKESSIYNHYINKEDILDAILEYHTASFFNSAPGFEVIERLAETYNEATSFWLATAEVFMTRIPSLIEPINQLLVNEMFLNEKCRQFITHNMFVNQKILTKNSFLFLHQKGWIPEMDFDLASAEYVYMLFGLETENRMKRLSGVSEETLKAHWRQQVGFFIDQLKKDSLYKGGQSK